MHEQGHRGKEELLIIINYANVGLAAGGSATTFPTATVFPVKLDY